MSYWLVKSEPEAYAWSQLAKDGVTAWTGVRNFAARLHLRAMKSGDCCFLLPQRRRKVGRRPRAGREGGVSRSHRDGRRLVVC